MLFWDSVQSNHLLKMLIYSMHKKTQAIELQVGYGQKLLNSLTAVRKTFSREKDFQVS